MIYILTYLFICQNIPFINFNFTSFVKGLLWALRTFLCGVCQSVMGIEKLYNLEDMQKFKTHLVIPVTKRAILIEFLISVLKIFVAFIIIPHSASWLSDWLKINSTINVMIRWIYSIVRLIYFKVTNIVLWDKFSHILSRYNSERKPKIVTRVIIEGAIINFVFQSVFNFQAIIWLFIFPNHWFSYGWFYVHISLLYSLHCFEFKWKMNHVPLLTRVRFIEQNCVYYCGFGLLLSLLSTLIRRDWFSVIFHILFPVFLSGVHSTERVRQLSKTKIPIFCCALWITNKITSQSVRYIWSKIVRLFSL